MRGLQDDILAEVAQERERQDQLFPGAWDRLDDYYQRTKRLTILVEEVGEVARAVLEKDLLNLEVELVQVAAVAVAWVEARRRARAIGNT